MGAAPAHPRERAPRTRRAPGGRPSPRMRAHVRSRSAASARPAACPSAPLSGGPHTRPRLANAPRACSACGLLSRRGDLLSRSGS